MTKFCQVIGNAAANDTCTNNDSLSPSWKRSGFGLLIKLSCREVFFQQIIHDAKFL
jgi:hypothetical protein